VRSLRHVLPAVRYACDAYVELVRERSLVEAVASSLTEHFAPDIMRTRIAAWEKHYPWVDAQSLAYFRSRVPRAARDAQEAIAFITAGAKTREAQEACVRALVDKCTILWAMLDAIAEAKA
jgi:pyrroloquinoline-quinone synthase